MADEFNILDGRSIDAFSVQKFGYNLDVDSGTVPEDIWDGGGVYAGFLAAAVSMEVLSSDANDAAAGTGMRTVRIFGLDANFNSQQEDVTLNGVTPVALANQYIRIFRAQGLTAGSGLVNAGTITIRVPGPGATLAVITAGEGQTLMALYTTPADGPAETRILRIYGSIGRQSAGFATIQLQVREVVNIGSDACWNTKAIGDINSQGTGFIENILKRPIKVTAGTDIRVRCVETSVNNSAIAAGFDINADATLAR